LRTKANGRSPRQGDRGGERHAGRLGADDDVDVERPGEAGALGPQVAQEAGVGERALDRERLDRRAGAVEATAAGANEPGGRGEAGGERPLGDDAHGAVGPQRHLAGGGPVGQGGDGHRLGSLSGASGDGSQLAPVAAASHPSNPRVCAGPLVRPGETRDNHRGPLAVGGALEA
jgi:hypothetical protein